MIWLSRENGIDENDLYLDVQSVSLSFKDHVLLGMVRGVIGDGVSENWCEMTLGPEESVQILPVWNEDGSIDSLVDAADEYLLSQQLLAEVRKYLYDKNLFRPVHVSGFMGHQSSEMNAQLAA